MQSFSCKRHESNTRSKNSILIPVIDLANFPTELDKLATASTTLGCFRVVNHGMPAGLAAEMKDVARSLFESPDEAKLRSSNDRIYSGGYIMRGNDDYIQSKYFESFGIYDATITADIHSFCSALNATIKQRNIICEYISKLHDVTVDIASKVAESLSFRLAGFSFEEWPLIVRLNSFNFTAEEDIGCCALSAHTDSNFMTVLQEDECVGGLEIKDPSGNFVAFDPVPGTLLVSIGDVGKAWSNGRLPNVSHRVICKDAIPRISIAMFLLAPKDDWVETPAAFIDEDHPKLYQTFIYNEYRKLRITRGFVAGEILPLL